MKKEPKFNEKEYAKIAKRFTVLPKKGVIAAIVAGAVALGGSVGAATYFGIKAGQGNSSSESTSNTILKIKPKTSVCWVGDTVDSSLFDAYRISNEGNETLIDFKDLEFNINSFTKTGENTIVVKDKMTNTRSCFIVNVLSEGEVNEEIYNDGFKKLDSYTFTDNKKTFFYSGGEVTYTTEEEYKKVGNKELNTGDYSVSAQIKLDSNNYRAVVFSDYEEGNIRYQPPYYDISSDGYVIEKSIFNENNNELKFIKNNFDLFNFENGKYITKNLIKDEESGASNDYYYFSLGFKRDKLQSINIKVYNNEDPTLENLSKDILHTFDYITTPTIYDCVPKNFTSFDAIFDEPTQKVSQYQVQFVPDGVVEGMTPFIETAKVAAFNAGEEQYGNDPLPEEKVKIIKDENVPLKYTFKVEDSTLDNLDFCLYCPGVYRTVTTQYRV